MSQRGKRGIAQCTKTYPATSYTVTFNAIGLADSDTAQRFATWMGVEVRARVSYLKGWKQITTQELDQLWLRAKLCSRLAPVEPSMPTKPRLDENALQRM
ncbi:hypothetical protein Tco_1558323, partial [Tanacetum coccineum]